MPPVTNRKVLDERAPPLHVGKMHAMNNKRPAAGITLVK
jgi:hypothetical protein